MRTQWTTKGNRGAGSSCLCDWGLHRCLQNFGGGLNTPNPPSVRHWPPEHLLQWSFKPSKLLRRVDWWKVTDVFKARSTDQT